MSEEFCFFWAGPFSQWHRCYFGLSGITYVCAEQWMMAEKARLFSDSETLQLILKTKDAKEHKRLGRLVKNFDPAIWNVHAKSIVYDGNFHKFTQNKDLLKLLYDTAPKTLVEASPYDKIWGIGLAENDSRALKRATWQGTNWLGETLTKLRDDLLAEGFNNG
jgi:ribA/ribD-fused uncharacterized protein